MVIYLPPTCASLTAAATPPPATLWRVIYINYSAMVGGAAPVNPRPRSARGGAVCFSWYIFFGVYGVVIGLVCFVRSGCLSLASALRRGRAVCPAPLWCSLCFPFGGRLASRLAVVIDLFVSK